MTVLRRLDCVLAPTKDAVLQRAAQLEGRVENIAPVLERVAGQQFFNTSRLDFARLLDARDDLAGNLRHYVASFSSGARDVIDKFDFGAQITRLDRSNLLYLVVSRFAGIDLHPDRVSNLEMGYLLFIEDEDLLTKPGTIETMLDPACGTGGDKVKIIPNEAFGFLRITVERPLRVRWEITDDTLAAVAADPKEGKLDSEVRAGLVSALGHHLERVEVDSAAATKLMRAAMAEAGANGEPLETAILAALAVRDPDADPITDAKGNAESDPDLRDNENVPLPAQRVTFEADVTARLRAMEYRTAIDDYMTAEVHPYVSDAWVDHDKTKIGYEIPLTRHFYVYTPPRPLAEIDAEIKALEAEIQELLNEVTE